MLKQHRVIRFGVAPKEAVSASQSFDVTPQTEFETVKSIVISCQPHQRIAVKKVIADFGMNSVTLGTVRTTDCAIAGPVSTTQIGTQTFGSGQAIESCTTQTYVRASLDITTHLGAYGANVTVLFLLRCSNPATIQRYCIGRGEVQYDLITKVRRGGPRS